MKARRRQRDKWMALTAGLGYVTLAPLAARDPGRRERAAFRVINQTGAAMPLLRVPQQLGTPWVLPLIAIAGFATHRPHLAVSATLALPVEKSLEVGIKKMTQRRRPAQVLPDAELHDDAPTDGPSYPSGHAGIATCAVTLAAPYLPRPVVAAWGVLVAGTTFARVHQGAHFPLDAAGGLFLGAAVGALLNYTVGLSPQETTLPRFTSSSGPSVPAVARAGVPGLLLRPPL